MANGFRRAQSVPHCERFTESITPRFTIKNDEFRWANDQGGSKGGAQLVLALSVALEAARAGPSCPRASNHRREHCAGRCVGRLNADFQVGTFNPLDARLLGVLLARSRCTSLGSYRHGHGSRRMRVSRPPCQWRIEAWYKEATARLSGRRRMEGEGG